MTPEQAQIVILQDALEQAVNTIEFLEGCLKNPNYKYVYPEQTQETLEKIKQYLPEKPQPCAHSKTRLDCPNCQDNLKRLEQMQKAQSILSNPFGQK